MPARTRVWPGRPHPLGATWDGEGVNFALFSENADAVELCLFDASGQHETARILLPEYTDQVWHGYLPDAQPNLLYGYRVYGPYRPRDGHRFNPHKLLLDPYAKALHGQIRWTDAHYGYRIGSRAGREDLTFDRRDNARVMPKCRVVDTAFTWGGDRRPDVPWEQTIIFEMHVRGMTMRHPGVDPARRGTFAGLVSPSVIDYLVALGVTTVELLPVQGFVDDRWLTQRGLGNYWGYNTIAFFAPEPRFLANAVITDFKTAVKRLHDAGIEVLLDVVYNHTGEGNHLGPTLCFRGIDNAAYYRLESDKRYYTDFTGTGNSLNLDHPRVLQMVMDSLRYWASEMHVDGFRFDLATTLARAGGEYRRDGLFLSAVGQDPVLSRMKLVAEPWDVGPNGYQLGNFPAGWAEWNGQYRDVVRRFWKGDPGVTAQLASRLAGSSDIFGYHGRRPWASVNFVTCHDGFTLQDLVSYNDKHNDANGEDNRDGNDTNHSWNCGAEGPTNDPEVTALRDRQKRNLLATLFLSLGVPMLLMGDEIGRTQGGNNNAYSQDNPISWVDWDGIRAEDEQLRAFVENLIHLRRQHRVFSRPRFFRGEVVSAEGLKDLTWVTPDGQEAKEEDWNNPFALCLGYVLGGAAGEFYTPGGQRDIDASFLVLLNAYHGDIDFHVPELPVSMQWEPLIDTSLPTGFGADGRFYTAGDVFPLKGRSFALFINRAPEKPAPAASGLIATPEPPSASPPPEDPPPEDAEDEHDPPV
ncbi:MAG TPA: glycogen debranching protein GlgX [Stellaceae bacterium]|nr:glycogen debranching protein GlgX [Stellaceae bacterium]